MPTETVNDTVTVSLDEIIETDLEGFLDLLDSLVNAGAEDEAGPLSDISYQIVGLGAEPNTIEVSVIAQRETEDNDDDGPWPTIPPVPTAGSWRHPLLTDDTATI